MRTLAYPLFVSLLLVGCTKEIDIDLNDSDPHIVIEGEVGEGTGPHTVRITRTVNFDEPNDFPAVTGATVVLADDLGNSIALTEVVSGVYQTSALDGQQGQRYNLSVVAEGVSYEAVSDMPVLVPLDSIGFAEASGFGGGGGGGSPGGGGGSAEPEYTPIAYFTDPSDHTNFYRLITFVNGVREEGSYVRDDRLTNGVHVSVRLIGITVQEGDLVRVELQCIDEAVHRYFETIANTGGGPGGSDAPANPESNISGGALGYFSARSTNSLERPVP